jgi:hypothetical protein
LQNIECENTSSSCPLIENAAAERAGEISTSSASFKSSAKARFHSSAKGPWALSLGRVPTFFYFQDEKISIETE